MASGYEDLRFELLKEAAQTAQDQRKIFGDTGSITLEYSLLSSLSDMLNAATMLTHTIDRVRFEQEIQS